MNTRPLRSASVSAIRICSPWPCRRRASSLSTWDASWRGSGRSTRRWWLSQKGSSPIVSGLVYCGVITGCQDAYELRRVQVDGRPHTMVQGATRYGGIHRHMHGASGRDHAASRFVAECPRRARRAGERCARAMNRAAAAQARYRQGEVHRLRGVRRSRRSLPGREPRWVGAAAGSGPVAPGPGGHRRSGRFDPPRRGRDLRAFKRVSLLPPTSRSCWP